MKLSFSIRQLLLGMIFVCLFAACAAAANDGNLVAYGILVGCLLIVIPILGIGLMSLFAMLIFSMTTAIVPVSDVRSAPQENHETT